MKKKVIVAFLCTAMACSLAACGSGDGDTESIAGTEYVEGTESQATEATITGADLGILDPDECVISLADYSAIQVSLTGDYAVSDDDVTEIIESLMANEGLDTVEVTDRTVTQAGDLVNVDFVGYLDGEAFDGGSATDQLLDIDNNCSYDGTNSFIDGFTADLAGVEVGSTVSTQVTFPEDYGVDTLNGQEVTFEFTINGIYQACTIDELTDDMVKEYFSDAYSVETVEDFKNFVRDYLVSDAVSNYVQDYMLENSEVEVPEDYLDLLLQAYENSYAESYGGIETLEAYMELYGTSLEEVEEQWREGLEESVRLELIFRKIAMEQNFEIDDELFANYVNNFVESSSYDLEDETAVYEYFGYGDADYGKEYLQNMYLASNAIEYAIENAVVSEE